MMNSSPFPDPPHTEAVPLLKRKLTRRDLVQALMGAAVGGVIGYAGVHFGRSLAGSDLKMNFEMDFLTVLLLPASWLVVVLVHEFGHLLGGRLAGMRPLMLFAGPLHFEFGADGAMRLKRNRVRASFGGLAVCAPRVDSGRSAFALLVAGGPFASFVLAALLLPAGFALSGWWGGLLLATGALSAMIGMLTLVPLRAGGFTSDGGQLLGLARDDAMTRRNLAMAPLLAASYSGVRPRDWSPTLLEAATSDTKDPTQQRMALFLRATVAEDRGDLDQADALWRGIATGLSAPDAEQVAPAMRGAIALGVAAWIAHRRREGASARRWLNAANGGFTDPSVLAFTEGAVAAAEGDAATARRKLEEARTLMPRLVDRGGAVVLAESISDILRDLDLAIPPPTAATAQT